MSAEAAEFVFVEEAPSAAADGARETAAGLEVLLQGDLLWIEREQPGLLERLIPGRDWNAVAVCREGDCYVAAVQGKTMGGQMRYVRCWHPERRGSPRDGALFARLGQRVRERALRGAVANHVEAYGSAVPVVLGVLPWLSGEEVVTVDYQAFEGGSVRSSVDLIYEGLRNLCEVAERADAAAPRWAAFEYFEERVSRTPSGGSDYVKVGERKARLVLGGSRVTARARRPEGRHGGPFTIPSDLEARLGRNGVVLGSAVDAGEAAVAWSVGAQWCSPVVEGTCR